MVGQPLCGVQLREAVLPDRHNLISSVDFRQRQHWLKRLVLSQEAELAVIWPQDCATNCSPSSLYATPGLAKYIPLETHGELSCRPDFH